MSYGVTTDNEYKAEDKTENFTMDDYCEMRLKYLKGEITEEKWSKFCFLYLVEMMEDNKDVLKRLKNL